jgi:hypothetical protein
MQFNNGQIRSTFCTQRDDQRRPVDGGHKRVLRDVEHDVAKLGAKSLSVALENDNNDAVSDATRHHLAKHRMPRPKKRNCGAVPLGVHYLLHRTTGQDRVAHAAQDHNQPRCHRILIWVKHCKAADINIEYCTVPSLNSREYRRDRSRLPGISKVCADKAEGPESAPAVD